MDNKTHTENCKQAYQETVKKMKPLMSKGANTMDIKKKWYNVQFESSCSSTKQFSDFSRNIKKYIKDETGIAFDLISFNKGHFYFSGFLKNKVNGQHIYFCCSDVRYFPNQWHDSLLVRIAIDDKDYTGGINNKWCLDCGIASLNSLASKLTY